MVIDSFRGKYFFLSNFYESPVIYDGITYLNNEAAFQAQKTLTNKERLAFAMLNPSQAKKLGRSVSLRPDWEDIKIDIMYNGQEIHYEGVKASFMNSNNVFNLMIQGRK